MIKHVIVRTIERADLPIVDQLGAIGTATIHEAIGRVGYVGPELQPIQQGVKIAGSAVTVLSHPGDNIMIHAAVEMCEPGDILVVATTAPSTHGMFGDLLATSLLARGVRGLVMDAAVRDTMDLRSMGFPCGLDMCHAKGQLKTHQGQ
ncbi:MAG: 4-carboxy-4-hydroxy-2-oxoadipate aldolase/oxaloacetate decarboxylase [Acidimicrobiales bacterium]